MEPLLSLRNSLQEKGLLGDGASGYGSPDEMMLLSSGPKSHLATFSLLCGPSTTRILIRQPSSEVISPATPHSPMNGDIRLTEPSMIAAELQQWNGHSWLLQEKYGATTISEILRHFCPEEQIGFDQHLDTIPITGPFWTGAFAYDLVQWTQPIGLQYPPKENDLLSVVWRIDKCIIHCKEKDMIMAYSTNKQWIEAVNISLAKHIDSEFSPAIKPSQPPISNCTDEEHEQIVETIHSAIKDGQLYQLNYGRTWEGAIESEPWEVLCHSVSSNPAPYSGFVHVNDEELALICASPESLLSTKDDIITTAPIKGTRPRGASLAEELLLREDMISDRKERAEHRMLVDLMRNDVGVIAKPNQIWIERFDVETYAEVQHLVTRVQGRMKNGLDAFDAFQAVFPGGSITGCPRTVVCAAIDELEKQPRSFWTGSMGWFETKTNMSSWNIMIRTAELRRDKNGWKAKVTAGGGITIESNPKSEVAEAKWKANALLRSCGWMDDDRLSIPRGDLSVHSLPIEGDLESAPISNSIYTEDFKQNSVLLIDNLDSFTYNIAHMICGLGYDVNIMNGRRNNARSAKEIMALLNPSHVILGPGPGWPEDSPLTMEFAKMALAGELPPTLGICLGHQALGIADGWGLIPSPSGPVHGIPVECLHNGRGLFVNLSEINMTRYNSLTLLSSDDHANSQFHIDATDATKSLVLAIRSESHPVFGVQFHPESVGSQSGTLILDAFLNSQAHG